MTKLAIIGGSGLTSIETLRVNSQEIITTPFGDPSGPLVCGTMDGIDVVFLPRHGASHSIPPHQINYRANLWALHHIGITKIVSVAAVGGIRADLGPLALAIPDQIIDYTYGRAHTFFEQNLAPVTHVDFSYPYCEELRQDLLTASKILDELIISKATYGATQGPRLETKQEIQRMERDGCDLVGMTGMPEASLARELGMCYACCALVVNWAAGKSNGIVEMQEIEQNLHIGIAKIRRILMKLVTVTS